MEYPLGICRRELEKQLFHATAVYLTAFFLTHVSSCILTAEVMEEVGTLKCISESWEVISIAVWNLPHLLHARQFFVWTISDESAQSSTHTIICLLRS